MAISGSWVLVMTYNRACCRIANYTTRSYDLSGNTNWKADYFQGMPSAYPTTVSSCSCASVGAFSATYSNGSSGVGATLTSTTFIRFTCDSYTPAVNASVLYKDASSPEQNGIYTLTSIGSGSTNWVLTRRTDFDQSSEIVQGTIVAVTNGTNNHTTQWVMTTSGTVTVGTTAINWSNEATQGTSKKVVVTQAVDASRVYVGGSRCTDSTFHSWSVVCFDIDTGQKLWDYDIGGDCRKILIDPSGNVVCMVDIGAANYVDSSTLYTQNFVVLSPTGSLVNSPSFTQVHSPAQGSTIAVRTLDFCINEDGDYHILGFSTHTSGNAPDNLAYTEIYEWMSPQTSAPTLREWADYVFPISINRISGRDYIGSYAAISYAGRTNPTSSLLRSKSQQAAPHSTSDYDFRVPDVFYDNALFPVTNVATIAAAGATQGTATALVANKNYIAVTGTAGQGFRLPTGSTGDVIGLDRASSVSGATNFHLMYFYPPTGGVLDFDSSITRHLGVQGGVFICTSPGNWSSCGISPSIYSSLYYWCTQSLAVDANGNFRTTRPYPYPCEISYSSTGVPQYALPVSLNTPFPHWLCSDSSSNTYYLGVRSSAAASVVKRDSSGAFQWGHLHGGTKAIISNAYASPGGVYQSKSGYCPIQMDPDGTAVIVSGFDDSNGDLGPMSVVNDMNFVTDPG